MNKIIAAAAVAALAGSAAAQNLYVDITAINGVPFAAGSDFTADAASVAPGDVVSLTFNGEVTNGFDLFGLVATLDSVADLGTLGNLNVAAPFTVGASGLNISGDNGVEFDLGQNPFSFVSVGPAGALATADLTIGNVIGLFAYSSASDNAGLNFNSTSAAGSFPQAVDGGVNVISDSFDVVPTPGTLGVLGVAGLAAARRRR